MYFFIYIYKFSALSSISTSFLLLLPFVEGLKLSEDDGVVFFSNGKEDVVIDLVTAERSENIFHNLLRNFANVNM